MKLLLKNKKWIFFFIAFIVLFNLPFYPLAKNLTSTMVMHAWIVNFFLVFALFFISLFLKKLGLRFFVIALFLLSVVPCLVVFSYLLLANMHMHNDMFWVIFATNPSESHEYVDKSMPWQLISCILLYIFTAIFFIYKIITSESSPLFSIKKNKFLFSSSILILIVIFSFQYLYNTVSTIDFYQSSVHFFLEIHDMKKGAAARKHSKIEVNCELNTEENTFVVIIGESLSRGHMNLYGYHRPTTPVLDSLKNELHVYSDVVSPNTHTIAVLKNILTFADRKHPEYYLDKPSVIDLFGDAGFETYWISTQEMTSKWGGSYGIIAKESEHVFDLSTTKNHDGSTIPLLRKILDTKAMKNRIIFIHLMGSHNAYSCRYPKEFNHFNFNKDTIPNQPFLNGERKQFIDEYDNSVLYTDFVVGSVIKEVKKQQNSSSLVLFFSDHGEEVYDFRNAMGHFISGASTVQCEIPFILWCSELYLKENKDYLVFQEDRSYSTESFIHSISTLARLKYKDYIPSFSVFSKKFIPQERFVGDETYEKIKQKTEQIKIEGEKNTSIQNLLY